MVLKIATVAPDGSPWVDALRKLGERWREISDGQIELRLYPSGISGDESDIVRKMRINMIQGAALTAKGLGDVDPGIWGLCQPLLVDTELQFNLIQSRIDQILRDRYYEHGLVVLGWTRIGWPRWFSTQPIRTPDDLRKTKVFKWEGSNTGDIWKSGGFQAVNLSIQDVLIGLQMGMISSFAVVPLSAAVAQWFGLARYMTDMPWSGLIGGIVIRRETWESIDPQLRIRLAAAATEIIADLKDSADRMENDAIKAMQKHGLVIVETTPEQRAEWKSWIEENRHELRGVLVDTAMYDLVLDIRKSILDSLSAVE